MVYRMLNKLKTVMLRRIQKIRKNNNIPDDHFPDNPYVIY